MPLSVLHLYDDVAYSSMAIAVKGSGLGGLKKAMFILHCLRNGQTREQIVELLDGDDNLFDTWISFLMQYDWIEQRNGSEEWYVSSKGKEWFDENATMLSRT